MPMYDSIYDGGQHQVLYTKSGRGYIIVHGHRRYLTSASTARKEIALDGTELARQRARATAHPRGRALPLGLQLYQQYLADERRDNPHLTRAEITAQWRADLAEADAADRAEILPQGPARGVGPQWRPAAAVPAARRPAAAVGPLWRPAHPAAAVPVAAAVRRAAQAVGPQWRAAARVAAMGVPVVAQQNNEIAAAPIGPLVPAPVVLPPELAAARAAFNRQAQFDQGIADMRARQAAMVERDGYAEPFPRDRPNLFAADRIPAAQRAAREALAEMDEYAPIAYPPVPARLAPTRRAAPDDDEDRGFADLERRVAALGMSPPPAYRDDYLDDDSDFGFGLYD